MENINLRFKKPHLLYVIFAITTLLSCGENTSKQLTNKEGFIVIENALKSKFGDQAHYTDLSIIYNKSIGNVISVTVTQNPESLKMGQWNLTQDTWKQNQEISIELPEDTKASDFMFQLNDKINVIKLGGLVEKSINQLKSEKKIDNPILSIANVKFPKNGDLSKAEFFLMLNPEAGGTTFTFQYDLNGNLIKMDY